MITLDGAGAIILNNKNQVFFVKVKRRGMIRWELPARIRKNGESLFLTLYRCIEEESKSKFAVRIGKPVCISLNTSLKYGKQYFAMFFECTVQNSHIRLTECSGVDLPDDLEQEILDGSFHVWKKLDPAKIHPQHRKMLDKWSQMPDGEIFSVASDADKEHDEFIQSNNINKKDSDIKEPTEKAQYQRTEILDTPESKRIIGRTLWDLLVEIYRDNKVLFSIVAVVLLVYLGWP